MSQSNFARQVFDTAVGSAKTKLLQALGQPTEEQKTQATLAKAIRERLLREVQTPDRQELTPAQQQQLDVQTHKALGEIQTKNLGAQLPLLLQGLGGKTDIETTAFQDRTRAQTGREVEVTNATSQGRVNEITAQGKVDQGKTGTYASSIVQPTLQTVENLAGGSQGLRSDIANQYFALLNKQTDDQIASNAAERKMLEQQNSGLPGFLNNIVMPVLPLAAGLLLNRR